MIDKITVNVIYQLNARTNRRIEPQLQDRRRALSRRRHEDAELVVQSKCTQLFRHLAKSAGVFEMKKLNSNRKVFLDRNVN